MKTVIKPSIQSSENLHEIIQQLQASLHTVKNELAQEKLKNAYLSEQFSLAKQRTFTPTSEKNILQADLFDETRDRIIHDLKEEDKICPGGAL